MAYDRAELIRRLYTDGDDAWLRPGEVATVLRYRDRSSIIEKIENGEIAVRPRSGGKWRECNPEDVRRLYERSQQVTRAGVPVEPEVPATPPVDPPA